MSLYDDSEAKANEANNTDHHMGQIKINAVFLPPVNEVCEGYVFTRVCQSFCCRWYPRMPCRSPGPHPGENLRSLAWGESPGPHLGGLQAHHQGGLQAHTWLVSRPTHREGYQGPHPGGGWGYPSMH